jgi:hypothetical protein
MNEVHPSVLEITKSWMAVGIEISGCYEWPLTLFDSISLGFDCVSRAATLVVAARDEVAACSRSSVKHSAGAHDGCSFGEVAADTAWEVIERDLRPPRFGVRRRRELIHAPEPETAIPLRAVEYSAWTEAYTDSRNQRMVPCVRGKVVDDPLGPDVIRGGVE